MNEWPGVSLQRLEILVAVLKIRRNLRQNIDIFEVMDPQNVKTDYLER
jgi:hypothetical protein